MWLTMELWSRSLWQRCKRLLYVCDCQDGSAAAPMVSTDTTSMKELDLLSKDIDDLKRYVQSLGHTSSPSDHSLTFCAIGPSYRGPQPYNMSDPHNA